MTRRVFDSFNVKGGWWISVVSMVVLSLMILVGSVFVYRYVQKSSRVQRDADFQVLADRHVEKMRDEINVTVNFLYDLRGKMMTSEINEKDWQDYIEASELEKRYPGYLSVAYVEKIDKSAADKFIEGLKKESSKLSYKDYVIFPKTDNRDLYPIKYLYTKDNDVASMMGYDLGSSESFGQVMLETSVTGKEQMSPLLSFDKVISGSKKKGYVMMIPVYSDLRVSNLPTEQKRKYLVGFLGAFLKPENLFLGATTPEARDLAINVKDGDNLVFEYQQDKKSDEYNLKEDITLVGKEFKFSFDSVKDGTLPTFIENLPKEAIIGLVALNVFWYFTIVILVLTRSVSERLMRDALEDLKKFKQAVDGVSDLVIITNDAGEVLYANDAIVNATGYSRKEILGKKPSLWGRQMDKEFYEEFWKTIKIEKKPFWGELKNRRKTGEIYEVELRVWPILNEIGKVIFYVGIERDITKTKAVERMKTEFISLASHQLRTPLSAVKWFGKMMIDGEAGELTRTQKEYLNKIYESNEREIQLVNSLLNVSRIESGRIKVEPKATDIKQLVESVVTDLKVGLNVSVRKIRLNVEGQVPMMVIDPDLMRHAYLNLINNAIRYTREKGKIDITLKVKDGQLVTKISDDGIGIPKEEQSRIFEKFFRGSNALKKETDGSGLGLYLAKSVIESSGGKIWFKSKENEGTSFWFTLPISGVDK